MTNIKIYFDGSCNNAKELVDPPMGIGIAVFINNEYSKEFSNFIHQISTKEQRNTSNIAEWFGCVEAMRKANRLKKIYPDSHIRIFSDSQLIVRQFNGTYEIKRLEYLKYYNQARELASRVKIKYIDWVRREFNQRADWLSKLGRWNHVGTETYPFKEKKINVKTIMYTSDSKTISRNY